MDLVFAELSTPRRRELMSAVARYIAGILPWEAMAEIVESLSVTGDWKPGDRVKKLRGSLHGKILRILKDGRIVWQPNGMKSELIALPESLCVDGKR